MVKHTAFPPTKAHPYMTRRLTPAEAQARIANFITHTETQPWLHPDSQLSALGITFAAHRGPKGGLALHHLRRIEAGLRGENLVAETQAELDAAFGALPEGDDAGRDAMIDGGRKRKSEWSVESVAEWAEACSEAAFGTPIQAGATATAEHWQDKEGYQQE